MLIKNSDEELFPDSPVVKTQHFLCRGHKFNPWLGTKISHAAEHGQKKRGGGAGKPQLNTMCILWSFLSS